MNQDKKPSAFEFESEIPARYMSKVRAKLNEVNNKLRKKGLEPFEIAVGPQQTRMIEVETPDRIVHIPVNYYDVKVSGSPFDFGPYRARGWADLSKDPIQLHDVSDRLSEAEIARLSCAECDQCKTKRARQKIFLVENTETKETLQVGGECAKDIFNGLSPDRVASTLSVVAAAYEIEQMMSKACDDYTDSYQAGGQLGNEGHSIHVKEFVGLTLEHLKTNAFISKSEAKERQMLSTSSTIIDAYVEMKRKGLTLEQPLLDQADLVLDQLGARLRAKNYLSDMDQNLEQLTRYKDKYVSSEYAGFLAYLPIAADRLERNEIEQHSRHLGQPADKTSMLLQYLNSASYDSMYGTGFRHSFADEEGNALVMFSSLGKADFGFEKNNWIQADFQIKDHTEFRGVKQTQVKSMKVLCQWDFKPDAQTIEEGVKTQALCNMLLSSTQKAAKYLKKEAVHINDNVDARSYALECVTEDSNSVNGTFEMLDRWRVAGIRFDDLSVSRKTVLAEFALLLKQNEVPDQPEMLVTDCIDRIAKLEQSVRDYFPELVAMVQTEEMEDGDKSSFTEHNEQPNELQEGLSSSHTM